MMNFLRKLGNQLLGPPRPVESLVRNVLFLGFFVLLLLVVGVGYSGIQSIEQLEKKSVLISDIAERHFRLVLNLSETAGKIIPEAREVVANKANRLLEIPARGRLNVLKREMDDEVEQGKASSLAQLQEWREFEVAYKDFWPSMSESDTNSDGWHEHRGRLLETLKNLDTAVDKEREQANENAHQMSLAARRRMAIATSAVLVVGVIVAALAGFEIRRNLTQMTKAYASSAESRDYLQSLLDSLVSGVAVIGQDGTVQTISESFRQLPVVGTQAQSGQNYTDLFRGSFPLLAAVSEELSQTASNNRYYGRVDLGVRLFDVFTSPLIVAGVRNGTILVFVDVTETARAQVELRRNRALTAVGQMTAQIAHEIKNPLGSIRFAAELLKRQAAIEKSGDPSTIEVIERSVDHLASIVAELSEFARPKKLNRTETDLNALLDDLLPMVADRLNSKQMRVTKQYDPHIPSGQYDVTELRKLFLNLIINAVEASEPNSSLELKTSLNGHGEILVDITDHGSGMDPETLNRLFEPFYTTKEKGTGLGMAISKQIAELHRGDLTVVSQVGVGTTATVKLPLTKFVEADNKLEAVHRLSR
jgi:two-component system nitrogen regulation sensor histidine kinase GlnL